MHARSDPPNFAVAGAPIAPTPNDWSVAASLFVYSVDYSKHPSTTFSRLPTCHSSPGRLKLASGHLVLLVSFRPPSSHVVAWLNIFCRQSLDSDTSTAACQAQVSVHPLNHDCIRISQTPHIRRIICSHGCKSKCPAYIELPTRWIAAAMMVLANNHCYLKE